MSDLTAAIMAHADNPGDLATAANLPKRRF
jgi:hypothetical protein